MTHNNQKAYAANAWTVLKTFGYTQIVADLASAKNIHSLENVMLMDVGLHNQFDRLALWFEPIDVSFVVMDTIWCTFIDAQGTQSRYRVVHAYPLIRYNLPNVVEFKSYERDANLKFDLPNRDYLRIHAACCRISRLSGASGLFDKLQRDMEDDPDPITEVPAFAKSLYAHLEHVSFVEAY